MNRAEFIEALEKLTGGVPEAERARMIAYYVEMIDDRVEAGMTEEQAVAALGDPAALAAEFLPGQAAPTPRPDPAAQYVDALRELHIHMKTGDAVIRREPPANGAAAQFHFAEPEDFEWSIADGVLTITENPRVRRKSLFGLDYIKIGSTLFSRSDAPALTLNLGEITPDRLIFDSHGGDVEISDVRAGELMVLSSSSGDMEMRRCVCAGRVEINSRSGDVLAEDSAASNVFKAESISGDVTLRRLQAGELKTRATSGDIEIDRAEVMTLHVNTVSGDVELNEIGAVETTVCETTSGDIDIDRPDCRDLRLATTSGDIDVRLTNRPGGYSLSADTRSGDISLPERWRAPFAEGQAQVHARTLSGDITMRVAD